jgi:hypothetical protein
MNVQQPGRGDLFYFLRPLPAPLEKLRTAFYGCLAPIANRWRGALDIPHRYPDTLDAFLMQTVRQGRSAVTIPNIAASARFACGSGFPIGKPVLGSRRFALDHKLFCALPNLTIGNTGTFVLAQVLDPRFVHEAFDEARSVR